MANEKKRILFCRIGWAEYYDGRPNDAPQNGGAYNDDPNNTGFEIYNFKEHSGTYYGYVRTRGKIHFEKIENGYPKNAETMENVLVVWFAKNLVVGWYENAILYKNRQVVPDSVLKERDSERKIFLAKSTKAVLIPTDKRNFQILRGRGGAGQYNIWYGNEVWKQKVLEYISNYTH